MKKLVAFMSLLAAGFAGTSVAEALTDRQRLQKLAQQNGVSPGGSTPEIIRSSKVVCVCQDSSANGRLGLLVHFLSLNQVAVTCIVPTFMTDGTAGGGSSCADYLVIAR